VLCALFNVGVVLVMGWEAYNWRTPRENCKSIRDYGEPNLTYIDVVGCKGLNCKVCCKDDMCCEEQLY